VNTLPLMMDPSKSGLEKVLRDYQIEALRMVWNKDGEGVSSRDAHLHVNKELGGVKTISRASIINFLNSMCDEGVLNYEEETCKGGMRRKYSPRLDEEEYKKYIARSMFDSLLKDFPKQTIEALRESLGSKGENIQGL
jgi:predicted transcriptional regulator